MFGAYVIEKTCAKKAALLFRFLLKKSVELHEIHFIKRIRTDQITGECDSDGNHELFCDIVSLSILSYSVIRGIFRGIIREVSAIIGVVAGFTAHIHIMIWWRKNSYSTSQHCHTQV